MVTAFVSNQIRRALAEFGVDEFPEAVRRIRFGACEPQQTRDFSTLGHSIRHQGNVLDRSGRSGSWRAPLMGRPEESGR